jgi:hypothetical protein
MSKKTNLWWNKSRRAQSNTDYETWVEGGVVPTLNAFDNGDVEGNYYYISMPIELLIFDYKMIK